MLKKGKKKEYSGSAVACKNTEFSAKKESMYFAKDNF
jgi:hypothetical protein